ncbi:MAG TPA: hypothetical protein ENK51_07200 [Gammaproteobacteria bacterium]|nr:hypothetical protein [Gammaproteobacteria bacterium]
MAADQQPGIVETDLVADLLLPRIEQDVEQALARRRRLRRVLDLGRFRGRGGGFGAFGVAGFGAGVFGASRTGGFGGVRRLAHGLLGSEGGLHAQADAGQQLLHVGDPHRWFLPDDVGALAAFLAEHEFDLSVARFFQRLLAGFGVGIDHQQMAMGAVVGQQQAGNAIIVDQTNGNLEYLAIRGIQGNGRYAQGFGHGVFSCGWALVRNEQRTKWDVLFPHLSA